MGGDQGEGDISGMRRHHPHLTSPIKGRTEAGTGNCKFNYGKRRSLFKGTTKYPDDFLMISDCKTALFTLQYFCAPRRVSEDQQAYQTAGRCP
jgi:hypothetical protein